jgi:hypothetical protein
LETDDVATFAAAASTIIVIDGLQTIFPQGLACPSPCLSSI